MKKMSSLFNKSSFCVDGKFIKLIIGLGNSETMYKNTRHNIGLDVVTELGLKHRIEIKHTKFDSIFGEGKIGHENVLLVKSQTYMNLSGTVVKQWVRHLNVNLNNCVVIHDDISLPIGKIKFKLGGSCGGHNGVYSVIKKLNCKDFYHLKVGIGRPVERDGLISEYVLQKWSHSQADAVEKLKEFAVLALEEAIEHGPDVAMNKFHTRQKNL